MISVQFRDGQTAEGDLSRETVRPPEAAPDERQVRALKATPVVDSQTAEGHSKTMTKIVYCQLNLADQHCDYTALHSKSL